MALGGKHASLQHLGQRFPLAASFLSPPASNARGFGHPPSVCASLPRPPPLSYSLRPEALTSWGGGRGGEKSFSHLPFLQIGDCALEGGDLQGSSARGLALTPSCLLKGRLETERAEQRRRSSSVCGNGGRGRDKTDALVAVQRAEAERRTTEQPRSSVYSETAAADRSQNWGRQKTVHSQLSPSTAGNSEREQLIQALPMPCPFLLACV